MRRQNDKRQNPILNLHILNAMEMRGEEDIINFNIIY